MWHRLHKTGLVLSLALVLGVSSSCWAQAPTSEAQQQQERANNARQPYEIQADSAVFDQQKGTGIYTGHVSLTRGTEKLTANRMTLTVDAKQQLKQVNASGDPVTFSDGISLNGHANKLEYDVKNQTIHLYGDAFMQQGKRKFSGGEITYSMDSQRVEAKGGDGKRVKLVLPPADTNKSESAK